MKALGCYVRDIRVMFLAEAGAIGFFGGSIGCVLSGLISLGINVVGALYAAAGAAACLAVGQRCRRGLRRRYRWRNIYLDHTLAGDSWWRECDPLFGDSVVAVPVRRAVFHADRLAVRLRPGQ